MTRITIIAEGDEAARAMDEVRESMKYSPCLTWLSIEKLEGEPTHATKLSMDVRYDSEVEHE